MRIALQVLIFTALVQYGHSCTKKWRARKNPNAVTQPQTVEDAIGNLLGPNVKTTRYESGGDRPQDSCDGLSCNFESSCCWDNALPPADQLNWAKASGQPDAAKLQKNFKTATAPEGNYLLTASAVAGNDAQTAQFYSCPITCSNSDVTVKVKHWASEGVKVQVCTENDPAGPPQNCQDLPNTNGNQDSITVPKAENQRIVIQATGFTAPTGSAAMISDIVVTCEPCPAATSAAPETSTSPAISTPVPSTICKDVVCNFEDGSLCNYQSGGNAHVNFASQKVPFDNRLTGVQKPGEGQSFVGAYFKANKGEKSTLTSNTNFDKEYTIRLKYLEHAEKMSFRGCCNDENNCPYDSKPKGIHKEDYQTWKTASFNCPAGTTKLVLVGDNSDGANEGAVAIDDIQVLDAANPPESASQSACSSQGKRRRN